MTGIDDLSGPAIWGPGRTDYECQGRSTQAKMSNMHLTAPVSETYPGDDEWSGRPSPRHPVRQERRV